MFACSFVAFLRWFSSKSFSFLFLMNYQILQQNINQSETGTGGNKLLVERYVWCLKQFTNRGIFIVYRKANGLDVSCFVLLFLKVWSIEKWMAWKSFVMFYLSMYIKKHFTFYHLAKVQCMQFIFHTVAEDLLRPIYINLSEWYWKYLSGMILTIP